MNKELIKVNQLSKIKKYISRDSFRSSIEVRTKEEVKKTSGYH